MVPSQLRTRNQGAQVFRTIGTGTAPRRYGQGCCENGGLARRAASAIEPHSDAEVTPLADSGEVFVGTPPFSEEARNLLRLPPRR